MIKQISVRALVIHFITTNISFMKPDFNEWKFNSIAVCLYKCEAHLQCS